MIVSRLISNLGNLATNWTLIDTGKLASSAGVLLALLTLRRWVKSALALPASLIAMWLTGAIVLHGLDLFSSRRHGF